MLNNSQEPINPCAGCQRGLPLVVIKNSNYRMHEGLREGDLDPCTKERYTASKENMGCPHHKDGRFCFACDCTAPQEELRSSESASTSPTWQEEDLRKEAHLIADLYCPIQGEVNKTSNRNLAGYIVGLISEASEAIKQAKAEGYKDGLNDSVATRSERVRLKEALREECRQAERARLVGIAKAMIEKYEKSTAPDAYHLKVTGISTLVSFISQAQTGEETK